MVGSTGMRTLRLAQEQRRQICSRSVHRGPRRRLGRMLCCVCFCSKSLQIYLGLTFVKTTSFQNFSMRQKPRNSDLSNALFSFQDKVDLCLKSSGHSIGLQFGIRGVLVFADVCRCQHGAKGNRQQQNTYFLGKKKYTLKCAPQRTPSSGLSLSNKSWLRTGDVCALKLLNIFMALLESSLGPTGCLFVSLHQQLLGC